jgi:LysR family glycine cleavage system transcriptional activator
MRITRSPPLRLLRVFCVAARQLSFKGAAELLHLTPSAVSHQVLDLEDHMGVKLFTRKPRSLELTSAGRQLHQEVEPLLNQLEETIARVARQVRRRTVRLALPPFFASELFVPRLTSLLDLRPDLDIQVDTSDPRPSEHPAAADVSILLAAEPPPGLSAHLLFRLELAAVASPAVAQRIDEIGAEIFTELPLIVQRARPESWRDWAVQAGFRVPEPKQVVELDTMFAVARAAERGVGIALVPWALLDAWFEDGDLVRVSPALLATEDRYFLTVRPQDERRPEVQAVVQWALREFRREAPAGPSGAARRDDA